jgi:phospholipase/carboxylesterase
VDLSHLVYEPTGTGPHATIVALHGWGANAFDLLGLAPHLAGGRLLVISPQGPLAVPLGPGTAGFGWFPLTGGPPAGESVLAGIVERLDAFLAAAMLRYPIDPGRLVLLGFSQGGVLAYRLALHDPSRFAAVVALSSWLPPPIADRVQPSPAYQRLPAFVQHGTADEVIAVARARSSVERLRELGMPVTYREYPIGHEVSLESLRDLSAWLEKTLR